MATCEAFSVDVHSVVEPERKTTVPVGFTAPLTVAVNPTVMNEPEARLGNAARPLTLVAANEIGREQTARVALNACPIPEHFVIKM